MGPITLYIPKPPDNANGRLHWAKANREKKAFWNELCLRVAARHGIPRRPPEPPYRARLDIAWFAEREQWAPDRDNVVRRCKPAIDWLVKHRWLEGDTPEHLELGAVDSRAKTPEDTIPPYCTVRLTITPL